MGLDVVSVRSVKRKAAGGQEGGSRVGVGRLDYSKTNFSSYSDIMHKQPRRMSRACITLPGAGDLRFVHVARTTEVAKCPAKTEVSEGVGGQNSTQGVGRVLGRAVPSLKSF